MKLCDLLNYSTSDVCGERGGLTKGNLFGVELELEGRNVGIEGVATKGWRRERDGSLRGESIEFVLSKPLSHKEAKVAVTHLFSKFTENNVTFNSSVRTSTHVHLNFCDKPLRQAINFFILFTMLEEMLEIYSGEDRGGNLFCMSSRRSDAIVEVLHDALKNSTLGAFSGDRYKYAACNLSTLYKFGSVEVRTMRGADTADQVNRWLDILNELYEYSLTVEAPTDLIVKFSHLGADGFLNEVFKPATKRDLLGAMGAGFDTHQSLLCGGRLIQSIAYDYDEAFRHRPDPARKEKSLAKKGRLIFNNEGLLSRIDEIGRFPVVFRCNGTRWTCEGAENIGRFWSDDEEVVDCSTMWYSADNECFMEETGDGEVHHLLFVD